MSEQGETTTKSAIEKRRENIARLNGSFSNVEEANKRLSYAAQTSHLLSPVPQFSTLPDGVGLALSVTQIVIGVDTFQPSKGGTGHALLKPALLKIAAGLGIIWEPERCVIRKISAYCVEAYAVGRFRDPVSLEWRQCYGSVHIDMSDGSPDAPTSEKELAVKRKFLWRDAESKAMNRAIRQASMIKSSYTAEELAKPFVAVRAIAMRPADPALRREYDRRVMDNMMPSAAALFGSPAARALPPPDARPMSMELGPGLDYDEETGEVLSGAPPASARDATPPPKRQSAPRSNGGGGKSSGKIMFGRAKGQTFGEAADDDLTWYAGALRKSIDDEAKANFRDDNQRDLDAIEAELSKRRGEDAEPPADDDSIPDDGDGY